MALGGSLPQINFDVQGKNRPVQRVQYICCTWLEIAITQECGCVGFNGPDGRQGCVLTRTVESNQGSRLDGNESVADSFRSDLGGFKSWFARILGAFSLLRLPEKTSSREANSLP
ncbi:hypothetical protein TNCV_696671 [Trichonephila clavipes]|nr:hypothetical protein TNCV_696671 [Trichonephila clavipes]